MTDYHTKRDRAQELEALTIGEIRKITRELNTVIPYKLDDSARATGKSVSRLITDSGKLINIHAIITGNMWLNSNTLEAFRSAMGLSLNTPTPLNSDTPPVVSLPDVPQPTVPQPTEPQPVTPAQTSLGLDVFSQAIQSIVAQYVNPETITDAATKKAIAAASELVDKKVEPLVEQAQAAVREAIGKLKPTEYTVKIADSDPKLFKQATHKKFRVVLTSIANGVHVWLVGPAGSGKTKLGEQVAEALELKFYPKSCGPEMTSFDLLGYMDANGNYVAGILYEPFMSGGLLMLDEIDRSSVALTTLNSALANGYCSFPNGVQKRHEDFRVIAAGNTWGVGADRDYVSAVAVDAASLDRFSFIELDYDLALERTIAGDTDWTRKVQAYRKAAKAVGVHAVISPRASIYGNKLLAAGLKESEVENMVVFKSLDSVAVGKLVAKLREVK